MNRKINKKKAISSPAFLLFITLLLIFGMIWLIAISKMFAVNKEDIQREIEAGRELIRIYISIDEVYNGTSKAEKTRILITNQWGKTSIIDYFVVEDWNGGIISKGNLTIVLGAGEERVLKGNDILNTFKLNNSKYAEDFWYFKDHIRCINLHTKFGNTFGSSYKGLGYYTITQEYIIIRPTLITYNQTITTTYYQEYTLIIESYIRYYDCIDPINNVWRWTETYNDVNRHYVRYSGITKNLMNDIINPNYDPYGRRYIDGSYNYPAGILLTISHSLPWSCSQNGEVYRALGYEDRIMYFEGGLGVNVVKLELWELDQFGNEVRKIMETTSNSITFAMFGNYKLKRYFEGRDKGQITTQTTTTIIGTATTTKEVLPKVAIIHFWGYEGNEMPPKKVKIVPIDPQRWYIAFDYYEKKGDTQYVADVYFYHEEPDNLYLYIEAKVYWKPDTPSSAHVEIWVHYHEWPRGW